MSRIKSNYLIDIAEQIELVKSLLGPEGSKAIYAPIITRLVISELEHLLKRYSYSNLEASELLTQLTDDVEKQETIKDFLKDSLIFLSNGLGWLDNEEFQICPSSTTHIFIQTLHPTTQKKEFDYLKSIRESLDNGDYIPDRLRRLVQ